MQTILGGIASARSAPLALAPLTAEGLLGAALVAGGVIPPAAGSAAATAVFPADVYFDLKQALVMLPTWPWFMLAIALLLGLRATVLYLTLRWSRTGGTLRWTTCVLVAAGAALALLPAAVLFFTGTALRYAPFVWAGGLWGVAVAPIFLRRLLAARAGASGTEKAPRIGSFLGYAYAISLCGAAMTVLGRESSFAAAGVIGFAGPIHALMLLGWSAQASAAAETPARGRFVLAISLACFTVLTGAAMYDRHLRDAPPVAAVATSGHLLLLGGADSTSRTGALHDIDPRYLGVPARRTRHLSYSTTQHYDARDTHGDLDAVARRVAAQIAQIEGPRLLLGHSQAALILDRLLEANLPAPDRAANLAPPPPMPPDIPVPPPGRSRPGTPGADAARVFDRLLEAGGIPDFDIDAPASPVRVDPLVVEHSSIPRLAVWPVGDSVWLTGDWRRPGETNVVAFTDHVGVVNNPRALDAARSFLQGRAAPSDSTSWRSFAVTALRYAFEPWRPAWQES